MKLCTVHGAIDRSRVSGSGPSLVQTSTLTVPWLGVRCGSGGSGTGRAAGSSGVSVYWQGPLVVPSWWRAAPALVGPAVIRRADGGDGAIAAGGGLPGTWGSPPRGGGGR